MKMILLLGHWRLSVLYVVLGCGTCLHVVTRSGTFCDWHGSAVGPCLGTGGRRRATPPRGGPARRAGKAGPGRVVDGWSVIEVGFRFSDGTDGSDRTDLPVWRVPRRSVGDRSAREAAPRGRSHLRGEPEEGQLPLAAAHRSAGVRVLACVEAAGAERCGGAGGASDATRPPPPPRAPPSAGAALKSPKEGDRAARSSASDRAAASPPSREAAKTRAERPARRAPRVLSRRTPIVRGNTTATECGPQLPQETPPPGGCRSILHASRRFDRTGFSIDSGTFLNFNFF